MNCHSINNPPVLVPHRRRWSFVSLSARRYLCTVETYSPRLRATQVNITQVNVQAKPIVSPHLRKHLYLFGFNSLYSASRKQQKYENGTILLMSAIFLHRFILRWRNNITDNISILLIGKNECVKSFILFSCHRVAPIFVFFFFSLHVIVNHSHYFFIRLVFCSPSYLIIM